MRDVRPFRDVRSRLLLIVLLALVVALGAATLVFNVLFAHATSRDANAFLRDRAVAELSLIQVANGQIRISETSDDALGNSRIWIFRGSQAVEQPRASASTRAAVRSLVGGPPRFRDVSQSDDRLYAAPIVNEGQRVGTLVTDISLAPYEQTRRTALTASIVLFVVLLTIVGFAVWWLLRSALRPVAQMTEQAAAWSERDLDRRFALGEPHDELTRLAATLDGLLDRLSASLRHERRFSAEMSHELRTPLAKLMAEAEVALRRDRTSDEYRAALEVVGRNAEQIARIVETLVTAARQTAEPQGVANAAEVADVVLASCRDDAAARGISLELADPVERVRVGVDGDLVERILHPVVENACRYGRSSVQLSIAKTGSSVFFHVHDDGQGIAEGEEETIFEPAVRGRAGGASDGGAGLGLALARRLARAAEGDVEAQPGGGGSFVVRLPAA